MLTCAACWPRADDDGHGQVTARSRMALFREFRDRFNEVERAHMQPVIDAYTRVCDNRQKGKEQRDRPVVAWEPDKPVCSVCDRAFTNIRRRHHCRLCGRNCCDDDAPNRTFRFKAPEEDPEEDPGGEAV